MTSGPSGVKGYLVEYRKVEKPGWLNAKTGQGTGLTALAARPQALSGADLVMPPFLVALPAGSVIVRVRGVSAAGIAGAASVEIKLQVGPLPADGLGSVSAFPNPFDSRTRTASIVYTLSQASETTIDIFDLFGRLVTRKSFSAGANGGLAGVNVVQWDGSGDGGKVSMGVYLCVIRSGGAKSVLRLGVIH